MRRVRPVAGRHACAVTDRWALWSDRHAVDSRVVHHVEARLGIKQVATAEYDSELDDPEDGTTGYEDEADAEGDFAAEVEPVEEDEDE